MPFGYESRRTEKVQGADNGGLQVKTEQNVLQYIRSKRIDIALLSARTGLNEQIFSEEASLEWNADEFLRICSCLNVDPWYFDETRPANAVQKSGEQANEKDKRIW